MTFARDISILFGVACLAAMPLAAQQDVRSGTEPVVSQAATATTTAPASLAPTVHNATVGVRQLALVDAEMQSREGPRNSTNVALMIVGGAGMLVGAIIGGDEGTLVMVGSAVIGLIGLYRYVK